MTEAPAVVSSPGRLGDTELAALDAHGRAADYLWADGSSSTYERDLPEVADWRWHA
ncbi:hypothetical protein ACFQ61_24340 [Streptomyces sp. NPDC056500]|uniref:hypothetical protein n=1 Tax=Streptomyces sp. NPDC056500 TaxID=3345840 RepID=UPI0036CCEAF5